MLPVLPEPAAVIVAVPAPIAETSPLPETVATAAFDVVQVNDVPLTVAPFASFATAEACVVPPTVRLLVAGVTAIDATLAVVDPVTRNLAVGTDPAAGHLQSSGAGADTGDLSGRGRGDDTRVTRTCT